MLELRDVTHIYPNGTKALDNVTLSIPKGMFGLLGPNGAGKSTLMRTVATLQTPTQGHIQFGDIDILQDPESLRERYASQRLDTLDALLDEKVSRMSGWQNELTKVNSELIAERSVDTAIVRANCLKN